MSVKDVDWSVLAQSDFFAVENLVQTPDRPAMRTVEPMKEGIFRRNLRREQKWKNAYQVVCSAYENLAPNFEIRHDSFGCYRVLYAGKDPIQPLIVLKQNPIGFIKEVPEGVVTNLSVMSSERTGKQLLLLVPMRFVNSDCSPNCEYDFSSEVGIVQLRVRKRINHGDEILVKYGPDFFEMNACRCRTFEVRSAEETWQRIVFKFLLESLMFDLSEDVLMEESNELAFQLETETATKPKRRRIKGRELVERFNELCESPPFGDFSHSRISTIQSEEPLQLNSACDLNVTPTNSKDSSTDESDDGQNDNEAKDNSCLSTDTHQTDSAVSNENCAAFEVIRASSPTSCTEANSFSLSEIDETDSDSEDKFSETKDYSDKLFDGTETTLQEASDLTDVFCSNYKLSDERSDSLHSLIRALLPVGNNFPSGSSHVRKMKKQFEEGVRVLYKTEEFSVCVLMFRFLIRDIVQHNLQQIINYSEQRRIRPHLDFKESICPRFEISPEKSAVFNLILFSDGVNIKKSTLKKEVWPIWIGLADLPPKLRMARKNVVLAALHVGSSYPNWNKLVPHIQAELRTGIQIESFALNFHSSFKVRLMISDLGAKNHMLNMYKFNGFYGCHVCTTKEKTIGRTHAYYPYADQGTLRECSINDVYVNVAEKLTYDKKIPNVVGVKGRSAFASLIEGLPLTAPVDYMHCILLGVFPDLLKFCYRKLSADRKRALSEVVDRFSCPREMISYSRKIRSLEELYQFKANEYFNWLFYISPLVFLHVLPSDLYSHLLDLAIGIRLLLDSCLESHLSKAKKLLDNFCKEIVTIRGEERIETINVHCVQHLAGQVRRFGTLISQSAMSFEAANRSLGELFSGSHSECEVICRRILQRHRLSNYSSKNLNSQRKSNRGFFHFLTTSLRQKLSKKLEKNTYPKNSSIKFTIMTVTLILQHIKDQC